jgi:hypothetical protein
MFRESEETLRNTSAHLIAPVGTRQQASSPGPSSEELIIEPSTYIEAP